MRILAVDIPIPVPQVSRPAPNRLAVALRATLAGVGAVGLAVPALAAPTAAAPELVQTGSRMVRSNNPAAASVVVIDRQQIERSGHSSLADLLRSIPQNSFGSARPASGSTTQSFAGLGLRGLGEGRTLVLIDGRRAPKAPNALHASDLNAIPLAAVERIEILAHGASAIYGSDAVGGAVNIILRRDFEGAQMSFGVGRPTRNGGETEEGSLLFGASSDRGSITAGASYNNRGIVLQRERFWSRGRLSTFSNNFMVANMAPGTSFGFTPGGFLNHPSNGSGPPGGCDGPGFSVVGPRCFYDFTIEAADDAELRNRALLVRADYQITDDWSTYLHASVSRVKSFGRYAPAPSSPWPGGQPFIPVGSPNHPALRFPDAGYDASRPVFLRHRFAAVGELDTATDANVYDVTVGFQGRIGTVELDFGLRQSEFKTLELGRNRVVSEIAQDFIASGLYDIYDPFGNDRSVLDAMRATATRDNASLLQEVFATARFDLFELPGGRAGMAVGLEHRREEYHDTYDTLTSANQLLRSVGRSSGGDRDVSAAFIEVLLPVLDRLDIALAGRYDRHGENGSDFSPKLSLNWRPLESLALRASIGESFRAASLDQLNVAPGFLVFSQLTDPEYWNCWHWGPTCVSIYPSYAVANPQLESERARHAQLGLSWQAMDSLRLALDYYDVSIRDAVTGLGPQAVVNCLAELAPCPAGVSNLPADAVPGSPGLGLGVARDPVIGNILFIHHGWANQGRIETSGLDFRADSHYSLGAWGELDLRLQLGYVLSYRRGSGGFGLGDDMVDQPGRPKYRASLGNQWTFGDVNLTWNINHIDSTRSTQGVCFGSGSCADYGYSFRLPSWTTHDLQASWNTPWNSKLDLGVQNLSDKDPPLDPFDPTGRGYDMSLYDGYGRVPYLRYTQRF